VERNLDALVQELATRCQRIFTRAAGAATRSAVIKARSGASLTRALDARLSDYPLIIRERVVGGGNEVSAKSSQTPRTNQRPAGWEPIAVSGNSGCFRGSELL
jgi:hypothetical protein